jgi:hypothetical protein
MFPYLLLIALLQSINVEQIRPLFGLGYVQTIEMLERWNEEHFAKLGHTAAQIALRNAFPETLSAGKILPLDAQSPGAGLAAAILPGERLSARQINVVFCPASDRAMAIQILLSSNESPEPVRLVEMVRELYGLPSSLAFESHRPALRYPLPGVAYSTDGGWQAPSGGPPISVWNRDSMEIVFQPIANDPFLQAQLWFADKTVTNQCAAGK